MNRRTFVLCLLAAPLWADDASKAWEVLVDAASALTAGNGTPSRPGLGATYFLSLCDSKAPGYETLRSNIEGLLAAMDVQSSIDPVSNEGDDSRRTLEVDWTLRLVPIDRGADAVERRQHVKCVMVKRGRKWRIESLEPASFFALPR